MKCAGCDISSQDAVLYRLDNSIWVCSACSKPKPRVWNKYHNNAPKHAVNIMRGTPWGNKYEIGIDGDRNTCVEKHKSEVLSNPILIAKIKQELRGKDLLCCCKPLSCHGDILLEIANEV